MAYECRTSVSVRYVSDTGNAIDEACSGFIDGERARRTQMVMEEGEWWWKKEKENGEGEW